MEEEDVSQMLSNIEVLSQHLNVVFEEHRRIQDHLHTMNNILLNFQDVLTIRKNDILNPDTKVASVTLETVLEAKIMTALNKTSIGVAKRTRDIVKEVSSPKKEVNKCLYSLQRKGIVAKTSKSGGSDPRWYLA